jgi:hypothetical protein
VYIFLFFDYSGKEQAIRDGIAFSTAIMKDYEDIPNSNGMQVLRNVPNRVTGNPKNIVLRSITEDFWENVISTTEDPEYRFRVCAVGTPGVGKTKATPILIRLLLLMKRTVIYHVR